MISLLVVFATVPAGADDRASTCADAAVRGQKERRAGRFRAAHEAFLACQSEKCPNEIREDSLLFGVRLLTYPGGATRTAFERNVRLTLDGLPATLEQAHQVDIAEHAFRFGLGSTSVSGMVSTTWQSPKATMVDLLIAPDGPTAAPHRRTFLRTAVSVGLLALGTLASATGLTLLLLQRADSTESMAACRPACSAAALNASENRALGFGLTLGIGVVVMSGGALALLWPRGEP
jgi:hypothetical protein